ALAAVRMVEEKRSRAFTTRDCLRTSVTGWHHRVDIISRLDFAPLAATGHPLALALSWDTFATARNIRTAMDTLNGTKHGGKTLGQENVDFWVSASDFASKPKWPFQAPG